MHRPTVGLIALALLLAALGIWIADPEGAEYQQWLGGCVRVGVAMAALWLALPEFRRTPRWLLRIVFAAVIVLILFIKSNPRVLVLLLLAGLAYAVVKPRFMRRKAPRKA